MMLLKRVFLLCALAALPSFAQTVQPGAGPGGTVKTITAGCGLAGGPITSTGTLSATGPCWAAGGGTAQAQTATFSPAATLTDGFEVCWKPTAANTGPGATFAPNGLAAHTIVKAGGALVANDIITTAQACALYNSTGTQWELQNPQTTTGTVNPGTAGQLAYYSANGTAISGLANSVQLLSAPTVTLTASQVNSMGQLAIGTPILIIPAQGVGTLIQVNKCQVTAIWPISGGVAFSGGGNWFFAYKSDGSVLAATGVGSNSTFFTSFSASQTAVLIQNNAINLTSNVLNQGVYLTNQTAAFTGGNNTSVIVNCTYFVLSGLQ